MIFQSVVVFYYYKMQLSILITFGIIICLSSKATSILKSSSWRKKSSSSQSVSSCSILKGIELIYHVGDYLLLSLASSRQQTKDQLFYLYNTRNGQMYGQPLELGQVFASGEDSVDDILDGRLVFATTLDSCSLKLDSESKRRRRRRRRRKRQLDVGFDFGNGFITSDQSANGKGMSV